MYEYALSWYSSSCSLLLYCILILTMGIGLFESLVWLPAILKGIFSLEPGQFWCSGQQGAPWVTWKASSISSSRSFLPFRLSSGVGVLQRPTINLCAASK